MSQLLDSRLSPSAYTILEILLLTGCIQEWRFRRLLKQTLPASYVHSRRDRRTDELLSQEMPRLIEDGWIKTLIPDESWGMESFALSAEGLNAFLERLPEDYDWFARFKAFELTTDPNLNTVRSYNEALFDVRAGRSVDGYGLADENFFSERFFIQNEGARLLPFVYPRYVKLLDAFPRSAFKLQYRRVLHFLRKELPSRKRIALPMVKLLLEHTKGTDIGVDVADMALFYVGFLTGEITLDEALPRSSASTEAGLMLRAVKALGENDPAQALVDCKAALKLVSGRRYFEGIVENLLYGLSLYLNRSSASVRRTLGSLLKNEKMREHPEAFVLGWFAAAGTMSEKSYTPDCDCLLEAPQQFAIHFVLALFHPHGEDSRRYLKKFMENDKTVELLCEFFIDEAKHQLAADPTAEASAFKERYGIAPVFPRIAQVEQWEKVLDTLIEVKIGAAEKKPKSTKKEERIAYLLDTDGYKLQPVLETVKRGGVKSLKEMRLQTFAKGHAAMTPVDREVADCLQIWNYGRTKQYELSGFRPLSRLLGHPAVYNAQAPEERIEIVEEPFVLKVKEKDGDWHVESNWPDEVDIEAGYGQLRQPNKNLVSILTLTKTQAELFSKLVRIKRFPPQAKDKLKTVLETASETIVVKSPLVSTKAEETLSAGDTTLTVFLCPEEDRFSAEVAVCPVKGQDLRCVPGKGLSLIGTGKAQVARDLKKEADNFALFEKKLEPLDASRASDYTWELDTEGCLTLLSLVFGDQTVRLVWPEGEKFKVTHAPVDTDRLNLGVTSIDRWFKIEGEVVLDRKTRLSIAELLSLVRDARGGFIEIGENEFVKLTDELRRQLQTLEGMSQKGGKKDVRVSAFHAGELEVLKEKGLPMENDGALDALIDRIGEAEKLVPSVPAGLTAELRDYQREGFEWMSRLAHWGAGALLADDMGLGKTVQTIALLVSRASKGPSMVVLPTSVLHNWMSELTRFAPGLSIVDFNRSDRDTVLADIKAGQVLLVTYGVMAAEIEKLSRLEWATVVLDEAHAIKNRQTKMSKAVMELKSEARILLTGTPLQNNLSEIWALFEFANPGLLGNYSDYQERFILPIEGRHDRERQRLLKRLISPFILRRTKTDVLEELPTKTTVTQRVELSDEERALYEELRERASSSLESGEINTMQALAELTRLRLAACHPALVNENLPIPSSKTAAFLELAGDLIGNKHRALVFSQFTSHLALIRAALDAAGIEYLYLDGADSASKRQKLVETFKQGSMPLFLISLKAGGTGLNLTAADYVIHLDPWWNPAIEDQASDRAYRIGQERPVTIYRLIAKDTIEEKILKLHETKKQLADALLEGSEMGNRFSKDEILKLLAQG